MPHKFRELKVWQRAMSLVTDIYILTRDFPQPELFGLTSQLRRAAVSVPLNIAEGAGSESANEFKRFLNIALKSTYETMTTIELAERLEYCRGDQVLSLLEETDQIAAMLVGLGKNLASRADVKISHDRDEEYSLNWLDSRSESDY